MIAIKKSKTDVLETQMSCLFFFFKKEEVCDPWAFMLAYRSFCLAGGEIEDEAQDHAPSCHWSSGVWQNISCAVSPDIMKMMAMNNNSAQKISKNTILRYYLFRCILCSGNEKIMKRTLFKWLSYYRNDNRVHSARLTQFKFWWNQAIGLSKPK